jgi:shikimate kinase
LIDDAKREGRVFVVYLRCDLATLESRLRASLAQDANRPSVTGADPVRELGELLRAREPMYRAIADVEVDGDRGTVEEVAARVVTLVTPPDGTDRR